jgi:hypothetical protein
MALQIDASTPSPVTSLNADVNVSASFTPPNRSLIVVLVAAVNFTFAVDAVSVSGGSLTWTQRVFKSRSGASYGGASGLDGSAEIWTAWVDTSPGSMTVTVTPQPDTYVLDVATVVLTGSEGSRLTGQIGASWGAAPILANLGGISSGSYIFAAATNFDAFGPATFGASQTSIYNTPSGFLWRTSSSTSAGSFSMSITAPSLDANLAAIEIKAATGGGSPSAWFH